VSSFDEVPWDLIVKAVQAVTDVSWVLLYVKRWLAAPLQHPDGSLEQRSRGTPQGSAVTAPTQSQTSSSSARSGVRREGVGRDV
jgi:retron-type reverse transcriptase